MVLHQIRANIQDGNRRGTGEEPERNLQVLGIVLKLSLYMVLKYTVERT